MKGIDSIVVARGEVITIRTNGPFTVTSDGEILGPDSEADRLFHMKIPGDMRELTVKIEEDYEWSYKLQPYKNTDPDCPGKIEAPVEAPLSLREEMRRFIVEELSPMMAEQGAETLEEANDFEIEDEMPEFMTNYELSVLDMEEEFLPPDQNASSEAVESPSQDVPADSDPNPVQQEENAQESTQEASAAAG